MTAGTIGTSGGRVDHGEHGAVIDDDAPMGRGIPWKCACGAQGRIDVCDDGMMLDAFAAWIKSMVKAHPPRRRRKAARYVGD